MARIDERRLRATGARALAERTVLRVPLSARFSSAITVAALLPLLTTSDYLLRVGVNTLIYALLAVGLNIAVGWVGVLDLGYVASFGFGAYLYALLSSNQFHIHWPSWATVPLVMVATAVLGTTLGLVARRLVGDYYAIITLFFAQAFLVIVTNVDRVTPPFVDHPINFTNGPNGIIAVDNLNFFGVAIDTVRAYYYYSLGVFALVLAALYFLINSRTGRAWRAMKDDVLVAELMGNPVNRLRFVAFACGAAVAGLTGTIFAAVQAGAFPGNFEFSLLITIYAMMILGGVGSLLGVVAGAVTVNVLLEVLRNPDQSRGVFYVVVILALVVWLRPFWISVLVIASTIGLGFAVRAIVVHLAASHVQAAPIDSGGLARTLDRWVVFVDAATTLGNAGYVALLVLVVVLSRLKHVVRLCLLPPTLYLAAFVWENRLADNPGVTRLILLGMVLIVFMNVRPRGLFGTPRVEST